MHRADEVHQCALALGHAIDTSTLNSCSSALNSYLLFIHIHNLPVEPTPDTLSFFAVFMLHHIDLKSVSNYLSGICQQLEPYFTNVHLTYLLPFIECTMKGCLRLKNSPIKWKCALTFGDLQKVVNKLDGSTLHDDLLFKTMLLTGFFALMRLGELTSPDEFHLQNWKKISRWSTVIVSGNQYEFLLPAHKADPFFEGNHIVVNREQYCSIDPLTIFHKYLTSHDSCFPLSSPLWVLHNSSIPTQKIFITHLTTSSNTTSLISQWELEELLHSLSTEFPPLSSNL